MRTARIKLTPNETEAIYHCISRTVNGERILDEPSREILRKQLWLTADFCGLQVLTYTLLSNHFHILVRVPESPTNIPDAELLRRHRLLRPHPTPYQTARIEVLEAGLKTNTPEATAWRNRQLTLMGDVSQFMKLLKQRFTIHFNKTHNRYGTLWSERFKSLLVEPKGRALETIAAYIDLNCVRAGLANDPKDYRFCGYAEALAGNKNARAGLHRITGGNPQNPQWKPTQAAYRETLFGKGAAPKEHAPSLTPAQLEQVVKAHGHLPLTEILRCRIRYFSDGAVLGCESFVTQHLERYRARINRRRTLRPQPLPDITDWGAPLTTLRALHKTPLGP
jgi:REP element-mobilizing transposase RayT